MVDRAADQEIMNNEGPLYKKIMAVIKDTGTRKPTGIKRMNNNVEIEYVRSPTNIQAS